MVLHYADLAEEAGGVDGFIIGSELVGLTRVRSAPGVYPAVARLRASAADVRAILGARHEDRLRGRLDGIRRACSRRRRRGALSPRSALRRTTTSTRSASTITRRSPTGATAPTTRISPTARSVYDVDYLRAAARQRRGLRLVLRQRVRPRRADAHGRSPTAPTASPGSSAQKDLVVLVVEPRMWSASAASRSARPPGSRNRSRSGSPRSAFPPSTRGRTARTSFPIRNRRNRPIRRSRAACATTSSRRAALEAILSRFDPAQRGFAAELQPGLDRLWRAHGRPGQRLRLGLGRAAFSGLSRFRHRVGGRRQLGDRPLDHRPDRGRAARPADRRASCAISASPIRAPFPSTVSSTAM